MCSIMFKVKDLNQSTHKTLPDIIEIFEFFFQNHPQSQISVIENSIILKYMLGNNSRLIKSEKRKK